jgi:lysyl-tRNA synthetase class 1
MGQFASSLGNVITVNEVLEVYEPEVLRFLFAGTRPKTEFLISFDLDVVKIYEDFDRLESKYYAKEGDERDNRNYELSVVKVAKKKPERIGFRHITMLVQIYEGDVKRVSKDKLTQKRAECAKNWLEKYAPDDFKFAVHEKVSKELIKKLDSKQKESLKELTKVLSKKLDEQGLFNQFYEICQKLEIKNTEFFRGAYLALIGKEKGPRLASFILAIGKDKVIKLLNQIK